MSHDNIALVRSLYEAFAKGDVPDGARRIRRDIEWNEAEGMPYGGQYHGPEAVAENVFGPVTNDFDDFDVTPEEILADGDRVVVLHAQGHGEGERQQALDAGRPRVDSSGRQGHPIPPAGGLRDHERRAGGTRLRIAVQASHAPTIGAWPSASHPTSARTSPGSRSFAASRSSSSAASG